MSFTSSSIQDYSRAHDIPEILSSLEINEKVTDMESLLKYSLSVLNVLEENQLNSRLYSFKGPDFAFLFQRFEVHYENMERSKVTQLIRAEHLIHSIADFSATQDISAYIKSLLQEMYDKPEISELIRLLAYKKSPEFFRPFAITFSKLLTFISPFLRYLRAINLDFLKIFGLCENDILNVAQKHLAELKSLLESEKNHVINENCQSLQEELSKLRILIQQDSPDSDSYFEKLGLWSFIHHLTSRRDNTFLNICLAASSYFSILSIDSSLISLDCLEQMKQINTSHHKLKELNQMGSVNFSQINWNDFIKQILTENTVDQLKLLHSTLLLSNENFDLSRQLLQTQTRNSRPLFFELWELIWKQREFDSSSQYLEGFLTYIDAIIYELYKVSITLSKSSQAYNNFFQQLKPFPNYRPLLKNQHYLLQYEVLKNTPHILQNLNFSDVPLIQILESNLTVDPTDLSLNLRETLTVIRSKISTLTKEDHQKIRLLFQKYLNIITNRSSDPNSEKLKHLGFFLTKILVSDYYTRFLRKIKVPFISAFITFLDDDGRRYSQMPWEFYKNICSLTQRQNFEPLLENEHFINFLQQIEAQASRFNKEPPCLFSTGQLRYLPLAQEIFHKLLLTSLKNIKQELDDSENLKVKKIQELWKRFTLFTLNWLSPFIIMNRPKGKAVFEKLEEMLSLACSICLHPSFLMYISQSQKKTMQSKFIKIVQQTKHGKSLILKKYFSDIQTEIHQLLNHPQFDAEFFLKSDPHPSYIPPTMNALRAFYFPERLKNILELFGPKEKVSVPKHLRALFYNTIKHICLFDLPQLLLKVTIPLAAVVKAEFQKYVDDLALGITTFIDIFLLENRHTEIKSDLPRFYEKFLSAAFKEDVTNANTSYLIDKMVTASQKLSENSKNELKNRILAEDFWWIYVVKRTNHYLSNYQDPPQIMRWYETLQYITSSKNPKDLSKYCTFQLEKLIASVVSSLADIINKKPRDFIQVCQEFWLQKTIKKILEIICNYSTYLKNQYSQDDVRIADLQALFTRNLDVYIIFETYKDLHVILDHTAEEMATRMTKHCLHVFSTPSNEEDFTSELFYIEAYTIPLISLILQQKANSLALQDDTLLLTIQKKTGALLETLNQQDPDQLAKIENSLQNITKLQLYLLTYFAMENRDCSTLFAPTFAWISSIFHLHNQVLQGSYYLLGSAILLEYLAALTQIALFSSPTLASSYLLEKTNLISSFLTVKTQTSRVTDTFVTILIITLDLYLWNALPSEMSIELDLKKELLRTYYFNLPKSYTSLTNQRKMLLEHEKTSFHTLVDTLVEKFGFEKLQPGSTPVLKFDPSKEIQGAQCPQKIDQVLNNLSTNAQNIIRFLTRSLLQNYSNNLSQIALDPNKPSHEVSGIMQILAIFAKKYPAVTLYLVFAKNDYSSIFTDQEDFNSITFFECLFKSKFFYMQAAAFHLLIEPLIIPSGITFLLDNQIFDLSHIFFVKLVSALSNQLDQIINNPTSILQDNSIILLVTNLVYYIQNIEWYSKNSSSRETKFPEALTTELALLFHKTLAAFQVLNTTAYLAFENFDEVYNSITLWLKCYYKDQLNQLPPNPDAKINKIKCDHYFQFLTRSDHALSSSSTVARLQELLCTIQKETQSKPQGLHRNYLKPRQPNDSFSPLEIRVWSILSNQRQEVTFLSPYCGMRQELSKKQAYWSDYESLVSKQMQGLADFSENKQLQHLGVYLTQKTLRLTPVVNFYSTLPSINSPIISTPNRTLKTWQQPGSELFQELCSRLSSENREFISSPFQLEWIQQNNNKPKDTFTHHSKATGQQKEKYFADYFKQPQHSVVSAQRALLLKLKIITEKVLAAKPQNSSANQKDTANTEINQALNQLPEAERPLLLCLIERFSILKKLYDYPPEFVEIQAEFQSAKATDPSRFPNTLLSCDSQSPNFFDDQTEFCTDPTSEAQENLEFTVNEDQVIEKNITFIMQQIPAFPDEVIESILSVFFINYQGAFCSSQSRLEMMDLLCNSPTFEIKLLDFCFFFLYCGTEVIQGDLSLRCTRIYNLSSSLTPSEVYLIATANILNFLKDLIQKREYPLYLPRFFFEQYSLKKLQPLKDKTHFLIKTSGLISVSDLLIGLLQVDQITANLDLQEIIASITSTNRNFKIIKSPFGQELSINESRILSLKSCDLLLDFSNSPFVLVNSFHFQLDKIIDKMEHQILTLAPITQQIIENLKSNLSIDYCPPPDFQPLTNLLTAIVVAQAEWLSNIAQKNYSSLLSPQQSSLTEIDQLFLRAFEKFFAHILQQHEILDFLVSLFELAEHLANPTDVVKLCRLFYNLIALKNEFRSTIFENRKSHEGLSNFPALSNVKSTDSVVYDSSLDLPELTQTHSSIRRTKIFNFDLLFIHLFKKHSKSLLLDIYQDNKTRTLKKEINYLCKKVPWILPFPDKQAILKNAISQNLQKYFNSTYFSRRTISINRGNYLDSAIRQFLQKSLRDLRQGMTVGFNGEGGYDAGGLRAEFLTIILRELFGESCGLFAPTKNSSNLQINVLAQTILGHLKYFEFAGMMLAKAIQEEVLVDVNLTKSLLKHILGRRLAIRDLEDIDPDFTKTLRWMLENSVEGLDQTFTFEAERPEGLVTTELIPNGSEIDITDENKRIFVDRICEVKMKEQVSEELQAFLKGFYIILPPYFFDIFSPSELQILICGLPTIDLQELEKYTVYEGYNRQSDLIKWLWEILHEFSEKERALFVYFTTGSMKISQYKLQNKKFKIQRETGGITRLPVAHTCFNSIVIPPYPSKEELKDKLLLAIYDGKESFNIT